MTHPRIGGRSVSEIPEDKIDAILDDLLETITCDGDTDSIRMNRELAHPIVRAAILAERERCAKIAGDRTDYWRQRVKTSRIAVDLEYAAGCRDGSIFVAKLIRGEA